MQIARRSTKLASLDEGIRHHELEKVVFGFVILLAATLNFGFVYDDIDNPALHHP